MKYPTLLIKIIGHNYTRCTPDRMEQPIHDEVLINGLGNPSDPITSLRACGFVDKQKALSKVTITNTRQALNLLVWVPT